MGHAIGVLEHIPAMNNLVLRSLTTFVAIPVVLATIWLGSPIVDLIVWVLLLGALAEWANLCGYSYTHGVIAIGAGIALYTTYGVAQFSIPLSAVMVLTGGWLGYHFLKRLPIQRPLIYLVGTL